MKIAVYAISRNESGFVERFCHSAYEADYIVIADTGSDDDTIARARACGASVHEICISPWRFDRARGAALALVPADVDVCIPLDLDEVMMPGWRAEIERIWQPGITRMSYMYDWGSDVVFRANKIHQRRGYYWHHPCHEYPYPEGRISEAFADTDMLLIKHLPDPAKSRSQYLDLLRLSIEEDPHCSRNAFYHARELTFYAMWKEAIPALQGYLAMPDATWPLERCFAMRLLGQAHAVLGEPAKALQWHQRAVAEASWSREPWASLASFAYSTEDWLTCYHAAKSGLAISQRTFSYVDDPVVWGFQLYDLAAISAYHIGLHDEAVEMGTRACELAPGDERLAKNLTYYQAGSTSALPKPGD